MILFFIFVIKIPFNFSLPIWEKSRKEECVSVCWFTLQMSMIEVEPDQKQEPKTGSGSASWMAGNQLLEWTQLPPRVCIGQMLKSEVADKD